ncbi:MAG: cytochrome c-type biogenesis protein CcmH [candidate division NC10 bacterium]|nr:cytochrome c-type biogenesis protein CcmH [candidate division NC10 bacterium]MBI4390677.1 cytochrome c-type biogenesis protein CcmH [candidate division NC10 bacterium]
MRRGRTRRLAAAAAALVLTALASGTWGAVSEEEVQRVASHLRCPVCQNLSVADSPSEMAKEMRGLIRERLERGETPEEVTAYFVSKYGEWVLLSPRPSGFNLLVWLLPFAVVLGGAVAVWTVVRRWHARAGAAAPARPADPATLERVRREVKTPERGSRA